VTITSDEDMNHRILILSISDFGPGRSPLEGHAKPARPTNGTAHEIESWRALQGQKKIRIGVSVAI
jgi:hypothetical protein